MNAAVNADTDLVGLTMRERVAHFRLMVNQYAPYLSPYVYSLVLIERPGIGTMAVDKWGRMYFDPAFVDTLTLEEGGYVVLHEAWHLILRHCHRSVDIIGLSPTRQQRETLNVAYDVVVWELMEAIAHHAPKIDGGSCITFPLMKERYPELQRNMLPQEIFNIICQQEEERAEDDADDADDETEDTDDEEFDPDTESEDSDDDPDTDWSGDWENDESGDESEDDEEGDDAGDPGEESDDGDGDEDGDDADEGEDGEGEGEGDDDAEVGTPVPSDKPGEPGKTKPPAYEDLTQIGGGSCADGEPRDYEEEPNHNWSTFIEDQLLEQVEKKIEEQENRAWQPGMGNIPGCLKEAINHKLRPQPDPWKKLQAAVGLAAANPRGMVDYSYSRPNRRQHALPTGFPKLKHQQRYSPKAVVIIDTSASMTTECKRKALNVIAQGLQAIGDVRVICGDTRVHSDEKLSKLTNQFEMKGGGGTCMVTLIDYAIEQHKPDVIVMATDTGTNWPARKIRPQLIIAATQQGVTPTWATTVYIPDPGKEVE
jgi:predicted metal-dependent peptidase